MKIWKFKLTTTAAAVAAALSVSSAYAAQRSMADDGHMRRERTETRQVPSRASTPQPVRPVTPPAQIGPQRQAPPPARMEPPKQLAPALSRTEPPAQAPKATVQPARQQDTATKRTADAVPSLWKVTQAPRFVAEPKGGQELKLPPSVPPIERSTFGATNSGNLDLAPGKRIGPIVRPSEGPINAPADLPKAFQPGMKLPGTGCRSFDVTPEIGTDPGQRGITGGRIDWGCTFR